MAFRQNNKVPKAHLEANGTRRDNACFCFYKRRNDELGLPPNASLEYHVETKAWVKWRFMVLTTVLISTSVSGPEAHQ